ncbi:MAG: acyl-CoA reductase [Bacteroidia bacterium]|nr:acyl-CoA reductase [Bacteroidia bacterium]
MKINERIEGLAMWGHALSALLDEYETEGSDDGNPLRNIVQEACRQNPWFTAGNCLRALKAIAHWLEKDQLMRWAGKYDQLRFEATVPKRVGLVMAGNIPAVGFHDLLSTLISGNIAVVKCSSDDSVMIPFLTEVLLKVAPSFAGRIVISKRLEDIDAVIATGSNNTSRYFDYYFRRYPHIIRKNRNSVAILRGDESDADLRNLAEDIFSYFGLGCRNVSKLYVPAGYVFDRFFRAMEPYGDLMQHNKYMNNLDYHSALYLLNNEKFLTNNFLLLREHPALATPVSVVHYEVYANEEELSAKLEAERDAIQCIVGGDYLPFGTSQQPGLADYADGIDTVEFLMKLNNA